MASSRVSYLWSDKQAHKGYHAGVSLHSHTNQSKESLEFLANFGSLYPVMRPLRARLERRSKQYHRLRIDYTASYWTPPATPMLAFDLESRQIERLGLRPMVSITDHDSIHAPMLLRTTQSARHVPVSLEWTVPYGEQSFHLGVHHLPGERAAEWMQVLMEYTAHPCKSRFAEILRELHDEPNVLVIYNHPLWDLCLVGKQRHEFLVKEFLHQYGAFIHALELNGLRNWDENRAVRHLAEQWNMLLVSGGDRHGVEPNANINLTNAKNFTEFVQEIRYEKRSEVLFMTQYAEPWKHRLLSSTLDAIRTYPDYPLGTRAWDERVFHPDANGVIRPLSALWPNGAAPLVLRIGIALVQMIGRDPISSGLRLAWNDSHERRMALGE